MHELKPLVTENQPRVVEFRVPPGKPSFGSVRASQGPNNRKFTLGSLHRQGLTNPKWYILVTISPADYFCYMFDVEPKVIACPG